MEYKQLANEFNALSDEEKQVLLIYKSRLGILINDLDNNPDYEKYYEFLKNVFSNPINYFIKMSVFKMIDMSTIDTFINSIHDIKKILDSTLGKIYIEDDIEVFRAVSSNDEITNISKTNIISTSLSFGEALKFAQSGNNIYLYCIKLHKNDPVMCIPYSIFYDEQNNKLILTEKQQQDEILLNKEHYDFEKVGINKSTENVTIIELDAKVKKEKTR